MYENNYEEYKQAIELFEEKSDYEKINITRQMSYKRCFETFEEILQENGLKVDQESLLTVLKLSDKDMDQKFSLPEFIHLYKSVMIVISSKQNQ